MSQNAKDNAKKTRGKLRGYFSLFLLLMVFILWGTYGILQSDFLNLEVVEIKDNQQVSQEEIMEASKLIFHRNILKFNLEEIEENINLLPYIKEATLERKLPRKLIIQVKEREEYAIISYMGGFIFVDMEAVILKSSDSYLFDQLPLVTGLEIESYKVGEKISAQNDSQLQDSLILIEAAKLTDMTDYISEIDISDTDVLRIFTIDGTEVLLGEGNNHIYSMLALKDVLVTLSTMEKSNVIIDLRYEGHVTVRDREGQEE